MPNYVDGFVVPVPKTNIAAYRKLARLSAKVWKEHGAPDYVGCIADDVKPGKWTSFPQAMKLKPTEVVWFSWIVYKSRRHRDQVNKKAMADAALGVFARLSTAICCDPVRCTAAVLDTTPAPCQNKQD